MELLVVNISKNDEKFKKPIQPASQYVTQALTVTRREGRFQRFSLHNFI
jgi:hypothetical protein